MRARLSLLALVVVALALPALSQTSKSKANPFHWSGKMSADQWLTVKGISGDIQATAASGEVAEVTAEKSGRDADQVQIQVRQSPEGVTICAIYPNDEDSDEPNTCGHSHTRDMHARVDFTVKVPRNVHLRAATVNGSVNADQLGASAEVSSVNGGVSVSTASWAEAQSVNGSVHARLGRTDWPDELRFKSVNGNVDVTVPADLNSDVRFSTLNGHIESDFSYTVEGGTSIGHPGAKVEARIGNGGRRLELESVNGNLELRKQ